MALPEIRQGYMGIGIFGGVPVRCTDFNVNVNQEFGFFDHTIGLNDTVPAGSATKGESVGSRQTQKTFVRPMPLTIQGTASFPAGSATKGESVGSRQTQKTFVRPMPLTIQGTASFPAEEAALSFFWNNIRTGNYLDFTFYYHCGYGRSFQKARLESLTLDVTAGDIVNVSVGFAALNVTNIGSPAPYTEATKLITWDVLSVSVNDSNFSSSELLKAFSVDIKNPLNHIYTLKPDNSLSGLGAHDLRIGMQEVSGTLTFYLQDGQTVLPDCGNPDTPSKIQISTPGWAGTINALLLPRKTSGNVGPVISTIGYVGIDKALR